MSIAECLSDFICVHYRDWQTGNERERERLVRCEKGEVNCGWTIESIEHGNCSRWYELTLTRFSSLFEVKIERGETLTYSYTQKTTTTTTRASCYFLCKYVSMQHHQSEHRLEMSAMKDLFLSEQICCINCLNSIQRNIQIFHSNRKIGGEETSSPHTHA